MTNKKRITKLEQRTTPPGCFLAIYGDPDQEGVFYDRPYHDKDRKRINPDEIDQTKTTIFKVSYAKKWRGENQT